MSISQSYLLGLYTGATGAGSGLLNTIYGTATSAAGSSGVSPAQALVSAEKGQAAGVAQTAAQGDVKTVIAAFTKAVNGAKSVTAMLSNPAVMDVLLTAAGMKDQIGYTALATKVLTSNLSNATSLANTVTDSRWKSFAQTYNFAANGIKALQNPKTIAAVAQGYAQITWDNNQDTVTPGLSNALAFIQQASTITSVDQLLGNLTVRNVVQTAYNIPQQIAFQSLNAQERAISINLDVKKLKDPKFVENLAKQYLIQNNINNSATASASSSPDLTTLAVQAGGILA